MDFFGHNHIKMVCRNQNKVTSVAVLANGFYKVDFIDMGIKGNRTLKIVNENGTLKFDSIK